jgi:hypothetical protein
LQDANVTVGEMDLFRLAPKVAFQPSLPIMLVPSIIPILLLMSPFSLEIWRGLVKQRLDNRLDLSKRISFMSI